MGNRELVEIKGQVWWCGCGGCGSPNGQDGDVGVIVMGLLVFKMALWLR